MRKQGKKIGVVSSFDPAGPNFRMNDESKRVSKNDAYYVEVFHTNMARTALGGKRIEFFANGFFYHTFDPFNLWYDLQDLVPYFLQDTLTIISMVVNISQDVMVKSM